MEKVRWAPKVQPDLIERVYREDAEGPSDETRIDDLGIRLLLRCEGCLRAMRGDIECPRCGREFNAARESAQGVTSCPAGCGWRMDARELWQSKRHRELGGGESFHAPLESYVAEYPKCRTPREKLLRIDRLIHEFHYDMKSKLPGRAVANNLIEGNHKQVVDFLDRLSAADPELKLRWRAAVDVMWRRRRGLMKVAGE